VCVCVTREGVEEQEEEEKKKRRKEGKGQENGKVLIGGSSKERDRKDQEKM